MSKVFDTLNKINVNDKKEDKNGFSYLSWTWAWSQVMEKYPDATYEIERFGEMRKPYIYDDVLGYMVFTKVTIDGVTREMWLAVMDSANKAMKDKPYTYNTKYKQGLKVDAATMFDINRAIMRCLVKNLAMFGLGLYIYAGEDLPAEVETDRVKIETLKAIQSSANTVGVTPAEITKEMKTRFNKKKPTEMTEEEGQELLKWLEDELKGE